MRTIRTKVYKFNELSKQGQENAINKLSDINLDYAWYECIYEDAANVGLKLTEFDLDRRIIKGEFLLSANEVAQNIFNEHGKDCETFKAAESFMKESMSEELEEEFLNSLLEDYRIMLQKDFDYNTSEKAIIETIKANEYEFSSDGKII